MSEKEKQYSAPVKSGAERPSVRIVEVDEGSEGQRVDNFLVRELPGVPKTRIYRLLRKGEIRVNKGRVKAATRLALGDQVRIPPIVIREPAEVKAPHSMQQRLLSSILFEDKELLVINKPSGVAVHGGSGLSFGVIEALRGARSDLADLALAHRIDRETSGVLVMTKRRSALRRLHEAFREERVSKVYLALVAGYWEHGECTIDAPLSVRERRGGERHVVVAADGKPSITHVVPTDSSRQATLMQVRPETGRTHQIRVHLAHRGSPIAMDPRYGDPDTNAEFKHFGLSRMFLHAQSIAFDDGNGNERLFVAPIDNELQRTVERLFVPRRRRR